MYSVTQASQALLIPFN